MNIALVSNTSWNLFNFRSNLVFALIEKGYQVFLIAPEDDYTPKIKEWNVTFLPLSMESKGSNPWTDWKTMRQLKAYYQNHSIDLVLHYTIKPNIYGAIAAHKAKVKSINNVTGLGTVFLQDNWVGKVGKVLYRYAFQFPYYVVFQNESDKKEFVINGLVSAEKCVIIPGSGVNTTKYYVIDKVKENETFTFLMPARLLWEKGINEYKEAAKLLSTEFKNKVRFVLIGATEEQEKFGVTNKTIAEWLKGSPIEYVAHTNDMLNWYHQADVVVLPSYREGTSKVLLEAASAGKPIITTNVPGCKEVVIDGENGLLVEVKNANDLYVAMRKMLDYSSEELVNMGKQGRRLIETTFADNIIINHYFCLIDNIRNNR
ncbi:MAG: glycosyltransferase family 4 protein [Cytophagaceae bacterium]